MLKEPVIEYNKLSCQRMRAVIRPSLAVFQLLGFCKKEVLHPIHILQDRNVAVFEMLGLKAPFYRLYQILEAVVQLLDLLVFIRAVEISDLLIERSPASHIEVVLASVSPLILVFDIEFMSSIETHVHEIIYFQLGFLRN